MSLVPKVALLGLIAVTAFAADYHFPTAKQNWQDYARTTFGPFALVTTGLSAGIEHLDNTAPEWRQGAEGYGVRYGDVFGRLLVQNTIQYGAATLLREGPYYDRCECTGLMKRSRHALISTFTARRRSGKRTLAVSALVGAYGGGMISTFWYPHRYTPWGDGIRIANYGFGGTFGFNIATEFWPDVRRKLFKK